MGSSGEHEGRFSGGPLPGACEQFWHGQGCPVVDVVHPVFPLLITASPTLPDALKDGFGEAVVACDTPEPCKSRSLENLFCRTEQEGIAVS